MHKALILLIPILLFLGCKEKIRVSPTFYYWKTAYSNNKTEQEALKNMHSNALYVRIMDIDLSPDGQQPIPVAPIEFKDSLPSQVQIIPVVYIVNNIFKVTDTPALKTLALRIVNFIDAKVKQSGKTNFQELQVDCDWTSTTRGKYFYFLEQLQKLPLLQDKKVTVTLRLHQVKNIQSSGIPPVKRAMLMCYNMGNLRKYGPQNSILDQKEMDIYLKEHLKDYPLQLDVALPLFNWAVVFRNQQYTGLTKRLSLNMLNDKNIFKKKGQDMLYELLTDLSQAGLKKGDIVRWEDVSLPQLLETADFLSAYLHTSEFHLAFYHLDEQLLKNFNDEDLQKVIHKF